MVTMLGVLTKTYGGEAVAKMIEAARASPKTSGVANRLQNGLTPDIVFQMMKVGEGGVDKLMSNQDLIKKLLTVYDDIPLAKAFEAATQVKTTEFMWKKLQQAQFKKWLADGVEPSTIFKSLNLDNVKWTADPNAGVYREYNLLNTK
ncbi:hypothetical protein PI124_g16693 [Phytophthora idaei]|nr:hypothetical protein PI125_g22789 [Phytophthora idaei]KAG3238347.1 hypothetical protein PI124_g16693 [Phytophthora idaei]